MRSKLMTDLERFYASVSIADTGCVQWNRGKDKDGYGLFRVGSRTDGTRRSVRAHRWSYEKFVGPIPRGLQIDHLCRNRSCVNHEHLEPVSQLENTRRGYRATATHCKHGHELSGTNLSYSKSGKRICNECRRRRGREFGRKTNWAAQRAFKERAKSVSETTYSLHP